MWKAIPVPVLTMYWHEFIFRLWCKLCLFSCIKHSEKFVIKEETQINIFPLHQKFKLAVPLSAWQCHLYFVFTWKLWWSSTVKNLMTYVVYMFKFGYF